MDYRNPIPSLYKTDQRIDDSLSAHVAVVLKVATISNLNRLHPCPV